MDTTNKQIAIGEKVRVRFDAGHFDGHFYQRGWRVGIVEAHSTIGESRRAGGWPTYDVRLRDGGLVAHCSPSCVTVLS